MNATISRETPSGGCVERLVRPPGFAKAAAQRGMTEDEYWAWCSTAAKQLRQWWDDLKALGLKPTDTPTEFLKRVNDDISVRRPNDGTQQRRDC